MIGAKYIEDRAYLVANGELGHLWEDAAQLLWRSLKYSDYKWTLDAIRARIEDQKAFLWVGYDENQPILAAVTWVEYFPASMRYVIAFCGAEDLRYPQELFPHAEEHARALDCGAIEIHGRGGWLRALPGFERISTTVRKKL